MSKKLIDISQSFIGNNGNKYFLKNLNYKLTGKNGYFNKKIKPDLPYHQHIIPNELINYPITPKCNILIPLVVDTEFTSYNGNINKLTKEKLKNLNNRQLIQIERLDYSIKKYAPDLKGIYELTGNKDIKQINTDLLDKVNFQAIPTLHLTTQIKHPLYNDEEILLNPDLKNFYEQHINNPNYKYPTYNQLSQGHIFDFLKLKGFQIEIGKKNEIEKEEFKKYKTCTFKLYAYFLLADLSKIFQTLTLDEYIKRISTKYSIEEAKLFVENQLFTDLKKAFETKKITQERRLKIIDNKGFSQLWHTQRLITINGLKYRLVFDLVDLGAMQGAISFNNVLENLGMDTSDKNLLDDLKDNMLLAMIERPADFKKYALGDLKIYEALKNHNNLFKQVYRDGGFENYFTEVKLTTGASVNDFQQSYLLKNLNLKTPKTENINLLRYYTLPASAKNLSRAINAKNRIANGEILKKEFLSKTNGGRCYNNRSSINTKSKEFTLADIDITGAYSSIASILDYYYGTPTIISFIKHKVSLREFLNYYEKKYFIKRGFKLAVETIKPFKIEQDLIPSTIKLKYDLIEITKNQDVITGIDLENTPTNILTKELINSNLTWDELNLINTEWTKKQRDEFLDNTYMISALFYPKNFQCQSVEELLSKKEIHKRFDDAMPYSYINNEDGEYSNYWYSTIFGKLGLDEIIQKRAENKKTNPSLAYLYKLIGNTLYGVNVSRHFDNSNILLAANITAMCRCGMWLTEKALNIYQTITDGGIAELNEVIHLMRGKIDTSLFVRAYQMKNRDLVQSYKWKTKPITENGKKIEFYQGKGWLIDDEYYGNIDKDIYVKLSKELEDYKKSYGENHELTKQKENELKPFENEMKKLFTKINKLVFNHIRKIFPNNDLFNSKFEKVKTDANGIGIKDQSGKYVYETKIGVFSFEVKNLCNDISFHGSADYMYTNLKGELTTKMRGYDVKPNVVAWRVENNNLVHDTNYYNVIPPIQRFMEDLLINPEKVKIQPPFTKTTILKPAQFSKEFNKTFQYCNLKCGDDFMEIVRLPIYTQRFKFQTLKQLKAWTRYYNSMKRRYCGLSFELFYLNKDNTINYQKMIFEVDKYISDGIINPQKIYDKYGNLKREMLKNKFIQNYIQLINWLKNLVRFTIIGGKQFIIENYKLETAGLIYKAKKQNHYTIPFYNSYNNLNTYSDDKAFRNYREN